MIVPDFGAGVGDRAMAALKKTIENSGDYAVKVVDLPTIVRTELPGEELTESIVIEFAARRLEQLASCDALMWDESDDVREGEVRTIKLSLCRGLSYEKDEPDDENDSETGTAGATQIRGNRTIQGSGGIKAEAVTS